MCNSLYEIIQRLVTVACLQGELESFLIEISASIFKVKDDKGDGQLIDVVLDKTGMKVSHPLSLVYATCCGSSLPLGLAWVVASLMAYSRRAGCGGAEE